MTSAPAVELRGLRIWVHGYSSPDATDAWDGNWLHVTAACEGAGSRVQVQGSILDTVSFSTFRRGLIALHSSLEGVATLDSVEPELKAEVRSLGPTGQMEVRVDITADQLNEKHRFTFRIDQSYLPDVIRGCEQVLRQFPVRDAAGRGL